MALTKELRSMVKYSSLLVTFSHNAKRIPYRPLKSGVKSPITDENYRTKRKEDSVARKKNVQIYRYKCTITDEEYKTTEKAENPDDLISVQAYYEMNPELDDRPEHIKKELGVSKSQ